jgi:hypothetical protein
VQLLAQVIDASNQNQKLDKVILNKLGIIIGQWIFTKTLSRTHLLLPCIAASMPRREPTHERTLAFEPDLAGAFERLHHPAPHQRPALQRARSGHATRSGQRQ